MVEIKFRLKTPSVPNCLMVDTGKVGRKEDGFQTSSMPSVDVADLTITDLVKIADEWKQALLANAERRRIEKAKSLQR